MLPILSLFALALAATLLPGSESDTDDDTRATQDSEEPVEQQASGTLGHDLDGDSLLSFATAPVAGTADTLSLSDEAALESDDTDYGDDLIGTDFDEEIAGSDGADTLFGFEGDDDISGGGGNDFMDGGDGHDRLFGNDDNAPDRLFGGEGHDQIWLGNGDTAEGGSGDDIFRIEDAAASVIADYNPDDDQVEVLYDPTAPVPVLTTETTDTGVNLLADGELVAVFSGTKDFDVGRVALIAHAA